MSSNKFHKICPEIALKYFFEINVVLYEIYIKQIQGDEYLCPWTVFHGAQKINNRSHLLTVLRISYGTGNK